MGEVVPVFGLRPKTHLVTALHEARFELNPQSSALNPRLAR
jgi:hypothetical protein